MTSEKGFVENEGPTKIRDCLCGCAIPEILVTLNAKLPVV